MLPNPSPIAAKPHNVKGKRMLRQSLGNSKQATLIMFYSRACPLCKALEPEVQSLSGTRPWLDVVDICADDFQEWAPEMLRYSITAVPCLTLLDKAGTFRSSHALCCQRNEAGSRLLVDGERLSSRS
jgi:Thioredoxin